MKNGDDDHSFHPQLLREVSRNGSSTVLFFLAESLKPRPVLLPQLDSSSQHLQSPHLVPGPVPAAGEAEMNVRQWLPSGAPSLGESPMRMGPPWAQDCE